MAVDKFISYLQREFETTYAMENSVLAIFLCVDRAFKCSIAQPACSTLDIPTRIKSPVQDLAESQLGRKDS